MNDNINTARTALQKHCDTLLRCENVVATGVGYKTVNGKRTDTPCIVCSVVTKLPGSALTGKNQVPAQLMGVPTDVVETGVIRALPAPTEKFRPAPGGVSVGHKDITAGTLGCWVKRNNEPMLLSNNHVLANSNDAREGDVILQPGPHDGGRNPGDQIATLEAFVPISFTGEKSGCSAAGALAAILNGMASMIGSNTRLQAIRVQAEANLVDAAIAKPLSVNDIDNTIVNIGAIAGSVAADLGMAVKKSGRTTGFTTGEIQQIDVTVNVQYGAGRIAKFKDQLMAGAMSQGGDSGSAVLDDQNRLTGLLFAGSDQTTIINRIENVFELLEISL